MTVRSWPVVVDAGPVTPADDAVRWAARESARRGLDLHVVIHADHDHVRDCRYACTRAIAAARAAAPAVAVSARPIEPLRRAEQIAPADAALLVVAGSAPHVDELIMTALCPVVVVPAGHAESGDDRRAPIDDARVVLAIGPRTGVEVVAFAFEEASARETGLLAVSTWNDPLADLGRRLPSRIARWDAADAEVRDGLADRLSACRLAYPDVAVRTMVVNDRCPQLLEALGRGAGLLVLGRPARGGPASAVETSPPLLLAGNVPCPVAVVPPPHQMALDRVGGPVAAGKPGRAEPGVRPCRHHCPVATMSPTGSSGSGRDETRCGMDAAALAERVEGALLGNRVYGEPVAINGTTVIPAARFSGGAGGGTGRDAKTGGEGSGGGLSWGGRPCGAFVVRDGDVRWQPAVDLNRLTAAVAAVAITALLTARTIVKVQAAARPR